MTLTELLIAAAITALVGAAVTAILAATSYGTTSRAGARHVLVQNRTTLLRLDDALRAAREVVAVNPAYLVLWTADPNEDETRQHGELQLIEWSADAEQICSYRNPADASAYANVATFRAAALAGYPSECWASGVTDAAFALVSPVGEESPLVSYRITAAHEGTADTAVGATHIPNAQALAE